MVFTQMIELAIKQFGTDVTWSVFFQPLRIVIYDLRGILKAEIYCIEDELKIKTF